MKRTALQTLDRISGLVADLASGRRTHESDEHAKRRLGRVSAIRKDLRRVLNGKFPTPLPDVERELRERVRQVEGRLSGDLPASQGGGGRKLTGHSDPTALAALTRSRDEGLLADVVAELEVIYEEHAQAVADDAPLEAGRPRRRCRVYRDEEAAEVMLRGWVAQNVGADAYSASTNDRVRQAYCSPTSVFATSIEGGGENRSPS